MLQGRPVAVLGGVRIPFCRQNTAYADVGNLGMSVRTLGALVEKFGLHGQQLGEVAMGAVIKHSGDWNLGREAALSSGLSPLTPGHHAAARLRHVAGQHRHHRQQDRHGPDRGPASAAAATPPPTCRSCTARSCAAACSPPRRRRHRRKNSRSSRVSVSANSSPTSPASPNRAPASRWASTARTWPRSGASRAIRRTSSRSPRTTSSPPPTSAASSTTWWSASAASRATTSCAPDTSIEKLATLKPAFDKISGRGTLTAGNSTPLTDGAAACLIASEDWAPRTATRSCARSAMRMSPRSISSTAKAC